MQRRNTLFKYMQTEAKGRGGGQKRRCVTCGVWDVGDTEQHNCDRKSQQQREMKNKKTTNIYLFPHKGKQRTQS